MWGWFAAWDLKEPYQKMNYNEPAKYKRKREKFMAVIVLIILAVFLVYQYSIYQCYQVTGDYRVCKYYGGDIEATNRMLMKNGDKQAENEGAK
ncbi:MAG: hypothetical protein COB14_04485 [Alphaproteobacteria bacterium]|nr:MAG: hypothetical protein COB14_04485 [Alphaproteobacteria bacterium]